MSWPAAPRVLIVDDNPGDALLAERALLQSGVRWSVAHCSTMAEAEAHVREHGVDAILLDLCLSGSEGGETIRLARGFAEAVPIVVLTGLGEEEALAEALEADADDFLPKERIAPDSIDRALRHALERRRLTLDLQRKRRELEQSEARLKTVLSTVSDGIVVVDETGTILFHNDAAPRLLRSPEADMVGRVVPGLVGDDPPILGVRDPVDLDAEPREVEVTSVRTRWEGRDARIASLRDITQRRRLEARIRAAQRIEAVGQLAGGMAHEMNNVLAVILANAGVLAEEPSPEERSDLIVEIEEASRRGARVVRRLLAYARRRRLRLSKVDLGAVVKQRVATVRRVLPDSVEIDVQIPARSPTTQVDPDAIEQILLNLLRNAHEAVEAPAGRIRVEIAGHRFSEDASQTGPAIASGEYVRLRVADNGHGMDAETVDRAFEPFFTTKASETGSGLGLATVYGLTKQQGGFVFIDSSPGKGTSVDVYFPVVEGDVETVTAPTTSDEDLTGSEAVLLAEDEADVRRTTARVLRRFGYTVYEAADGVEALEILDSGEHAIDIIVSDVVMPNMGGHALYEALQRRPSAPPILFVSGYTAEDLRRGQLLDADLSVLQKPWGAPDLLDAVRATLSGTPRVTERI